MNDQVNLLIGKTKRTSQLTKKRDIFHFIAVGSLFAFAFFSVALFILIALSPLPSLQEREKIETKRLSFFKDLMLKINLTKDRVNNVDKILRERPTYSSSLQAIKSILPPETTMKEIHLSDKTLTFTVTSNSLVPLDVFLTSLKTKWESEENFKTITIVGLEQNFDKGEYVLVVKLV